MNLNDIEIDAVTRRFEDTVAVDNVSMKVAKGELFGLLGPNGAACMPHIQLINKSYSDG